MERKMTIQLCMWCLEHQHQELEQLEVGEWPAWCVEDRSTPPGLDIRRRYADWCLLAVLRALVPVVPRSLRGVVQTCLDMRERIWSSEYRSAYYHLREKASPECLPASDSL